MPDFIAFFQKNFDKIRRKLDFFKIFPAKDCVILKNTHYHYLTCIYPILFYFYTGFLQLITLLHSSHQPNYRLQSTVHWYRKNYLYLIFFCAIVWGMNVWWSWWGHIVICATETRKITTISTQLRITLNPANDQVSDAILSFSPFMSSAKLTKTGTYYPTVSFSYFMWYIIQNFLSYWF